MPLRSRKPSVRITKAEKRFQGMAKIDEGFGRIINYGGEHNPLTKTEMKRQIEECKMLINEYNNMLLEADKKSVEVKLAEEMLGEYFTRVLAGAKSIFGVDSDEVEALGGTKKSERKKKFNN